MPSWALLLRLLALLRPPGLGEACSCAPAHPQQHVCHSALGESGGALEGPSSGWGSGPGLLSGGSEIPRGPAPTLSLSPLLSFYCFLPPHPLISTPLGLSASPESLQPGVGEALLWSWEGCRGL